MKLEGRAKIYLNWKISGGWGRKHEEDGFLHQHELCFGKRSLKTPDPVPSTAPLDGGIFRPSPIGPHDIVLAPGGSLRNYNNEGPGFI